MVVEWKGADVVTALRDERAILFVLTEAGARLRRDDRLVAGGGVTKRYNRQHSAASAGGGCRG